MCSIESRFIFAAHLVRDTEFPFGDPGSLNFIQLSINKRLASGFLAFFLRPLGSPLSFFHGNTFLSSRRNEYGQVRGKGVQGLNQFNSIKRERDTEMMKWLLIVENPLLLTSSASG